MEISIQPHEVAAAAGVLRGCARDLDAALAGFTARGTTDAVQLGIKALTASERGLHLTGQAVRVLVADLDQLADGLTAVASAYPAVDAAAVPRP